MKSFVQFLAEAAKSTHTHKGHCQACGRIQAVKNGTHEQAKHGYKVMGDSDYGAKYFMGTCQGSGHQPIQKDRSMTDTFVAAWRKKADWHEGKEAAHRNGTAPNPVETFHRDAYGGVKTEHVPNPAYNPEIHKGRRRWDNGYVPETLEKKMLVKWEHATPEEKNNHHAIEEAEHGSAKTFYRGHAKMMEDLANKVHKTDLHPNMELKENDPHRIEVGKKFKTQFEKERKVMVNGYPQEVKGKRGKILKDLFTHEHEIGNDVGFKPVRRGYGDTAHVRHHEVKNLTTGETQHWTETEIKRELRNQNSLKAKSSTADYEK